MKLRKVRNVFGALVAVFALAGVLAGQAAADIPGGPTSWPGGVWEPGPQEYGAEVVTGIPIEMTDGVTLIGTVAYPTDPVSGERAAGEFPVVLEQTPYSDTPDTFYTHYGYLSVSVRARGTGSAEGVVDFWGDRDAEDGATIVEWAEGLPGSNGKIGLVGGSWPGLLALRTAATVSPGSGVKAVVPAAAGFNGLLRETFLPGGTPSQTVTALPLIAAGGPPGMVEYFDDLVEGILAGEAPAYEGTYWHEREAIEGAQSVVDNGIAVLLWTGWGDHVERSALETYAALQNAQLGRPVWAKMLPHQPVSGRYQVISGDWGHGGGLDKSMMLEWFDTFVKGEKTRVAKTHKPMHLYEKGSGRWINAPRYPAVASYTDYHLRTGGTLSGTGGWKTQTETLAWAQPGEANGTLSFETAPLGAGATLAGPVAATVQARSSNTNLELIASLYDVAPGGEATLITDGAVLGSQRQTVGYRSWRDQLGRSIRPYLAQEGDSYLTPNRRYRFEVALFPRSWGIAPGHRLRLTLTSQTPKATCSLLTGSNPCTLTTPQQATLPGGEYEVYLGGVNGSTVQVPLLPYGHFPTASSGTTPTSGGVVLPLDWSS